MKRRLLLATGLLTLFLTSAMAVSAQSSIPGYEKLSQPCPTTPFCGKSCTNYPFQPTDCATTKNGSTYSPARANIINGFALSSSNMLWCPGGTTDQPKPYALCFFSGPTTAATGTVPQHNNVLGCVPDLAAGVANCQCQVYNTGSFYVDINSILNLGAFYQTKQWCGDDGSLCKNIANCDENGKTKTNCPGGCPVCPEKQAPVCDYVQAQSTNPDAGLYPTKYSAPSRVDLVSTFSFAMGTTTSKVPYTLGSTPCTNGIYAGCMTAPCSFPEGSTKADGTIVNCACPLWQGDYQIGQSNLPTGLGCPTTNAGWVWSAANSVSN